MLSLELGKGSTLQAAVAGEIEADTAIVPADVLSRQALDAQAEDLALEDALYSLDKALQDGALTPEAYMKQVGLHPCIIVQRSLRRH